MRKRKYAKPGETMTDAESYQLKGPVKTLMEIWYNASGPKDKVVQGKIELDSNVQETNIIYHFNQQGRCVYKQTFGAPFYQTDTYTDAGLHIESVSYYKGKFYSKTTFVYDSDNRVVETLHTNESNQLTMRSTVSYLPGSHQQLEYTVYHYQNGVEKIHKKTVSTYGNFGTEANGLKYYNLLSQIEYNADGQIECEHRKKYNEQGKAIEDTTRYTDEKKKQYDRTNLTRYNEHGDVVEQSFSNGGQAPTIYTYTYEYDANGKKIEKPRTVKPYDPFELEPGESEEVENDEYGNWIKKTTFFENRPVNIIHRQFRYYGHASENLPDFIHPATLEQPENMIDSSNETEPLTPKNAKWLAEGMSSGEPFPVNRYYTLQFNEPPSVVSINTSYVEAFALLSMLQENLSATVIHSKGHVSNGWRERVTQYVLRFSPYPGYLFIANNISRADEDEFIVPSYIEKEINLSDYVYFGNFQLLRPSDSSPNRDEWFEEALEGYIDDCTLRKKPEKPYINIVEVINGQYVMQEHPVDDNFEIRDLNINYGYGFQQFHDELMGRFNNSTKGLVLFHGEPGTGKTFYIRHLLRKMVASRKVVIYMPPNMVDHLTDPAFMTFLTREVRDFSAEGNFCVLLIEDAEPLLAKRQEGVRIQGVTNLLNLSDGLLNDLLNLQIICTFNVDLKKLDSALLRPGRLLARKEFKPLSELDANLLAQRLGIKHHFKKPATLSQVYALLKDQHTLIHDVDPDRGASTILDDL